MQPLESGPPETGHAVNFATTRWSIVLSAGKRGAPEAQQALAQLCETYWLPLYTYLRRQGRGAEEAQDLTQEFFSRLIEKDYLKDLKPGRGRFRSYLLLALKHLIADEWDKNRAQKRGGGVTKTFNLEDAEARYRHELWESLTPEKAYEKQWALTLLDQVFAELHREFADAGKEALFGQLKLFLLPAETAPSQEELAAKLGMSEGAVKAALHRLRRRFGEILKQTITHTVAEAGEVEDEIRYLVAVLRT